MARDHDWRVTATVPQVRQVMDGIQLLGGGLCETCLTEALVDLMSLLEEPSVVTQQPGQGPPACQAMLVVRLGEGEGERSCGRVPDAEGEACPPPFALAFAQPPQSQVSLTVCCALYDDAGDHWRAQCISDFSRVGCVLPYPPVPYVNINAQVTRRGTVRSCWTGL